MLEELALVMAALVMYLVKVVVAVMMGSLVTANCCWWTALWV